MPAFADSETGSRCSHGRNWARTSDPQLVELVLSQLSYAPVGVEFSAVPYATGAGGWGVGTAACPASAAAATPTPLARIVISNVSRLV